MHKGTIQGQCKHKDRTGTTQGKQRDNKILRTLQGQQRQYKHRNNGDNIETM